MYTQAHSELAAIRPVMAGITQYGIPMLSAAAAIAASSDGWEAAHAVTASPMLAIAIAVLAALVGGVDTDEAVRHESRHLYLAASASTRGATIAVMLLVLIAFAGRELPSVATILTFCAAFVAAMTAGTLAVVRLAISVPLRARPRSAVVVAVSEGSLAFIASLLRDPFVSIDFRGFFDDRDPARLPGGPRLPILGRIDAIGPHLAASRVEHVFICMPADAGQRIGTVMEQLLDSAASVHCLHDFAAFKPIRESLSWVAGMPVHTVIGRPDHGLSGVLKRGLDIVGAAIALVLLSPLLLATAIAIRLESPGPVLFRQQRYGTDGRPFAIFKFRSMTQAACASTEVAQATRGDMRVTRVGRFIRRTSIDELPQLFNILMGDMSLVGPRPHAVPHNEHYRRLIRGYMLRHKVRPGLTGWAQVHGLRGETETVDKMENRVRFDLDYLRQWSVALDLYIVLLTVRQVLRGV
jgi:putative colanic acid biosysnthesis UDP-glucose lipid carrier transferase